MTTIACDGKSIAGDGLVTGNGVRHSMITPKVFRLKGGAVAGFSGSAFLHEHALAFLNGERDAIDFGDGFEAIILHTDGRVECMDGHGRRYEQPSPCATGSGTPFALGAMAMGADAAQAVRVAISLDTHSGGGLIVLTPQANS